MPATLIIEVTDDPEVLAECAAIEAQIMGAATWREAFENARIEGVTRAARAALGGVTATPEQVAALVAAVERGDTGATLALLASR